MKILHITPSYFPAIKYGGPTESVHLLNKALVEKGIEVCVLTTNAGLENNSEQYRSEIYTDRIKFTDEGGQIGPMCHYSAYYNYKIQGNEVRYEFLGDQCPERIKALSAVWVRN